MKSMGRSTHKGDGREYMLLHREKDNFLCVQKCSKVCGVNAHCEVLPANSTAALSLPGFTGLNENQIPVSTKHHRRLVEQFIGQGMLIRDGKMFRIGEGAFTVMVCRVGKQQRDMECTCKVI